MTSYNITKEQRPALENARRDSLARYLIHTEPKHQQMFLKKMKSDHLRADLKERMREQLAIEVAKMDQPMRNLRMSRMCQRCARGEFEQSFYQDILSRVKKHLAAEEVEHG